MSKIKNCIIIPDSFKGTMSSETICDIAAESVHKLFPECKVKKIPVADGGEGTVDCFLKALPGKKIEVNVHGPYFDTIKAYYGIFNDIAVIETAQAVGITLVNENKNPSATTTFGVGELIRHAISNGIKKIYLGLGGSCTNDGGCGCAAALGIKFKNKEGKEFIPVGSPKR